MIWALLPRAGIEPQGNTVLQPAHFTVQTVDAGVGEGLVYIEDPEGHTEEVQWSAGDKGISRGLKPENTWDSGVPGLRDQSGLQLCDLQSFSFPTGQSSSQQ